MKHPFLNLLLRWSILAIGVVIAAKIVPGISYDDPMALIVVVLLLSFCNAVLRPILMFFALPFIIISLGFGILIINALLFYFIGSMVNGFHVTGFWPALGASLIVSLSNMLLAALLRPKTSQRPPQAPQAPKNDKDVIDI